MSIKINIKKSKASLESGDKKEEGIDDEKGAKENLVPDEMVGEKKDVQVKKCEEDKIEGNEEKKDELKEGKVKEEKIDEAKEVKGENKEEQTDESKEGKVKEENVDQSKEKKKAEESDLKSEGGSKHEMDPSNLRYEGDICYYTDPDTKHEYVWDEEKQEWVSSKPAPTSDPSSQPSTEDYQFDGSSYTYVDKKTNVKYKWDTGKNSWVAAEDQSSDETKENKGFGSMEGTYGYEDDTHTYTDPKDNTKYLWDREKNAWFPKVDDDFLAQYQMNYGFVDPNENNKEPEKPAEPTNDANTEKKKGQPQEPTWFEVDEQSNTKVYVSNLPLDITENEFVDVMQKCGLVMRDTDTNKMKVKLYTKPGSKQLKGDGLCTYIKKESVELALNLLDGYNLKDHRLHVERAKFTMKGSAYDPSLKPKKKKKKDKEKLKKMQEKLFDWRPDKLRGERPRNESVVIMKNLFEPEMFDKDVKLILEIQQDLREECQKCGQIRRIIVHDRHPEGVAQVSFKEVEAADACIQLMNGRWFGGKKISAEAWDGKTKYKILETEEEIKKRIEKWDKYLDNEEETGGGGKKRTKKKSDNSKDNKKAKTVDKDSDEETDSNPCSTEEEEDDDEEEEESTEGTEIKRRKKDADE